MGFFFLLEIPHNSIHALKNFRKATHEQLTAHIGNRSDRFVIISNIKYRFLDLPVNFKPQSMKFSLIQDPELLDEHS